MKAVAMPQVDLNQIALASEAVSPVHPSLVYQSVQYVDRGKTGHTRTTARIKSTN